MPIRKAWEQYREKVIPKNAHPNQFEQTELAFYAGASIVLQALHRISGDDVSEDKGVEILEGMRLEIEKFFAHLKKEGEKSWNKKAPKRRRK